MEFFLEEVNCREKVLWEIENIYINILLIILGKLFKKYIYSNKFKILITLWYFAQREFIR